MGARLIISANRDTLINGLTRKKQFCGIYMVSKLRWRKSKTTLPLIAKSAIVKCFPLVYVVAIVTSFVS